MTRSKGMDYSRALLGRIVDELLAKEVCPLATANSPLTLTDHGRAALLTGLSHETYRGLVRLLQDFREEPAPSVIATIFLASLGAAPEQPHRKFKKVVRDERNQFCVKRGDIEAVCSGWLDGKSEIELFQELPFVLRSTRTPSLQAWLDGAPGAEKWDGVFDDFVEFVSGVLCSYMPWLLRASRAASPLVGGPSARIDWQALAERFEREGSVTEEPETE